MKLLIIGGTVFLGRAVAEHAVEQGHQVTLFNRGQSNTDLFPGVEQLHGDRDGGLDPLRGRTFDACLDTCGYFPRIVRASAQLLRNCVNRYALVSSVSAYSKPSPEGTDESAELAVLNDATIETVTAETYGPLKVLCEKEVIAAFASRALVIRPGLIVGPHDPTDRFTYWPWRAAQGGTILAPGRANRPIQFIDVRDLAAWIVHMLDTGKTGVFNAVSTPDTHTMSDLLQTCCTVANQSSELVWVEDAFLVKQEVGAWIELPLWIPESDPLADSFFNFRADGAIAEGLRFRSLEDTVRSTMNWSLTRSRSRKWRGGLDRERERALLSEWLR